MEYVPLDQIHDPTLLSYDTACHRFLAVWKSFGKQGAVSRMKIRSAKPVDTGTVPDDQSMLSTLDSRFKGLETSIQLLATSIQQGKPIPPQGVLPTAEQTCFNVACSKKFVVRRNRQTCKECFDDAKDNRATLTMKGVASSGKDYTGKFFYIVDSADEKDAKRGGGR
jgi:hypothetical protein